MAPRRVDPKAVAWRDAVVAAVEAAAPQHGADADLLLDSTTFIDTLDDLVTADPNADWFPAAVGKKVQAAAEQNPNRYARRHDVDLWPILRKIDDYVRVADVRPIREAIEPVRKRLRA